MSNNQQQYHAPSPPHGQASHGQYQNPPSNAQAQQYGQLQNTPPSQPPQHYQQPQQAYQGNPAQYNQYQSGSYQHQSGPSQVPPYRPQAAQTSQQTSSQQQSTAQAGQGVNQPRSNTPGQSTTPTQSSSNQIAPGGAPARQYINETVAPYLLEGMKMLVREQPSDPLRVLGEWLIEQHQKQNENEMLH